MIRQRVEIAVVGAGFAGSLAALVFQRIGRRCALVERGTHPRFAIGESSTPTANLVLESLAREYDLPRIAPLSKYGRWQRTYPEISCGLKRGFSFFQHQPGEPFHATPQHATELLVGASPNDEIGDTHWYREGVDHFFVREAQAAGILYFDRTEITRVEHDNGWRLAGRRGDEPIEIQADFVVDATGPGGFLPRALGIETDPAPLATNSWSIYSHFTGVELWQVLLGEMNAAMADYPYPCDAAALHHVLADGWMWVLRFNNGVTSAGIAFDGRKRPHTANGDAEHEWQSALRTYPSLARQFARAERIRPWVRTGRMQRIARCAAGADWALLPHAAYFFDPLFSAGNAHTLVGIKRLAEMFGREKSLASLAEPLADYEQRLFREIEFLDWLVDGCYRTFGRFDLLGAYVMYYFAGAVQSEIQMRAGRGMGQGFLFSEFEPFRTAVRHSYEQLVHETADAAGSADFTASLWHQVASDIADYNPAGFCDRAKRNMYPFV